MVCARAKYKSGERDRLRIGGGVQHPQMIATTGEVGAQLSPAGLLE
jgi:hypothetical protein